MQQLKKIFSTRRCAILMGLAVAAFYFLFDPLESRFMPQCVFYRLTGWKCVGCGSQRMLHALLHGDLPGAFRANAFVVLMLPAILFLLYVELNRIRHPSLYAKVYSTGLIIATGVLLAAWFIVRNIVGI